MSGYSHGSSNYLAQDQAVVLQQAWLLLHDPKEPTEQRLTDELVEAAKSLQDCRARHGSPYIPAVRSLSSLPTSR